MRKLWAIIRREYLYNLTRRAFLYSAFGIPLIIVAIWVIVFLVVSGDDSELATNQIGYVDQAGVLAPGLTPDEGEYEFISYTSEDAASSALDAGEIAAYYVILEDYTTTASLTRYVDGDAPDGLNSEFSGLLLLNLTEGLDIPFSVERLADPTGSQIVQLQDSGRELTQNAVPVLFLLPFFFAILFSLALQTTSSYLMNGLVQEKTNRIIELLVVSVSPMQLLLGKVIALGLLGLTQVLVWILVAVLAFAIGPELGVLSFLGGLSLPLDLIVFGILYFMLGYFLTAGILTAIGVLAGDEQQSNQYAGLVNLTGYLVPIFFLTTFIEDSNGVVPVVLSMIPLTAPLAMVIRIGISSVPPVELALSIGIMVISVVLVSWASAKIFRWGLLMYGKRFRFKDLTQVILGQREMGVTSQELQPETAKQEASA